MQIHKIQPDPLDIVNRIDDDIVKILNSAQRPDVTAGLNAILRNTRQLRLRCLPRPREVEIAAGYHREMVNRMEALSVLLGDEGEDFIRTTDTLVLIETMMSLSAKTMQKYSRAAIAATMIEAIAIKDTEETNGQ